MKLHTAVAALAISASSAALANLVTSVASNGDSKISTSSIRATSAPDVGLAPSQATTQPRASELRWTWMPVKAPTESPNPAALAVVPVPSPGAAALIGLSALLVGRRRARN
jgi:hypothetical protein